MGLEVRATGLIGQRVQKQADGPGVEAMLPAGLLERATAAAAVVQAEALEQRGGGRLLEDELAERGGVVGGGHGRDLSHDDITPAEFYQ